MTNRNIKANKAIFSGFFVNIILVALKMIAGIVGHSSAIIADAFHSLSDFLTDIIVLWSFRAANKPGDKEHQYGHGKIETLAALIIGIFLFWVGARILWGGGVAIAKSAEGETLLKPGWIAFYAAGLSIVVKEWLYGYSIKVGKDINSSSIIANAWHHRSDVFSSIGVMLGIAGAILCGEKWRVLDPLAAVIVSFFIIKASLSMVFSYANELVEVSLGEDIESKILKIVKNVPRVIRPHNLKTRNIGNNISIDLHIKVDKLLNIVEAHDICSQVEKKLRNEFGKGTFISVHAEPLM